VLTRREDSAAPVVTDVSAEEITRRLAWTGSWLQFDETPLADAVAEFNRRNRRQLVLGDPALGGRRIGGAFRPENVEGFVYAVKETLGLRAETRGADETVLWPGP
jgi:transmembrane sensor